MHSRQLQKDFGILCNTTVSSKVMEGTYVAPEGSSKSVVGMLQIIREVSIGVKDRMVVILSPSRTKFNTGKVVKIRRHPMYLVLILATGRPQYQTTRSRNITQ